MTKENLWRLIDECCNDIFDKNEPLLNVKERLYHTLKHKLFTQQNIYDAYSKGSSDANTK